MILTLTSCTMPDYLLTIRMISPEFLPLGANSMAIVQLYGYDTSMAGQSATPLNAWREPLHTWGQEIQVAFSESLLQAVIDDRPTGREENIGFYFSVYVDNNSDGKICNDTDYEGLPKEGAPRMFTRDDRGDHRLEYHVTRYSAPGCVNIVHLF